MSSKEGRGEYGVSSPGTKKAPAISRRGSMGGGSCHTVVYSEKSEPVGSLQIYNPYNLRVGMLDVQ